MQEHNAPHDAPPEAPQKDRHLHPEHPVPVTIDGKHRQIKAGEYLVSRLKEVLGVDPSKELDQVICGEFVPLDDNAHIHIKGHEVFVSHVRSGGSS